mgnify:CR=1 FL=1
MESIEILFVENNPQHVSLMKETLKEIKLSNTLHIIDNSTQADAFLHRGVTTHPDIIFLALDLYQTDEWAIVSHIQKAEHLSRIPLVVIGPGNPQPVGTQAKGKYYLPIPFDLEQLKTLLRSMDQFALGIIKTKRTRRKPNSKQD